MARKRGNKGGSTTTVTPGGVGVVNAVKEGRRKKPGQGGGGGKGGQGKGERDLSGLGGYARPPLGTYDPGLDAQVRASRRGLLDLRFDTKVATKRRRRDFGTQRMLTMRDFQRDTQDIGFRRSDVETDFSRDLYDLAVNEQRGTEDYQRALGALDRRYGILAEQQAEQQAVAQVRGGAAQQAAQKRAANQLYERTPIDIGYQRQTADIGLRRGRLGENRQTALQRLGISEGRLGQDLTSRLGLMGLENRRTKFDARHKLSRAKREQGFYEQDVTQQAYFQAHQFDPSIKFPSIAPLAGGGGKRKRGKKG